MDRSRIIGGTICLALAILFAVLYFVLPPDQLMFMVGDVNRPYVPAIILGVVAVVLLSGSGRKEQEPEKPTTQPILDPDKAALNKRFETVAWGLFLIMLGGFLFVTRDVVGGGWWSVGVGLIMLGLNAARYLNGIRMSGFTTLLGIVSLIGGVLDLVGITDIEGGLLLLILGAYLLAKPWFERRNLFGKAEES